MIGKSETVFKTFTKKTSDTHTVTNMTDTKITWEIKHCMHSYVVYQILSSLNFYLHLHYRSERILETVGGRSEAFPDSGIELLRRTWSVLCVCGYIDGAGPICLRLGIGFTSGTGPGERQSLGTVVYILG